jgi:MFS family permease
MPLSPDIGMGFAETDGHGKMLGKLAGAENTAYIIGSLTVFLGFRFLHFSFTHAFTIAALFFVISAVFIFLMKKNEPVSIKSRFTFRKKYGLFYWLTTLYGTRKQIFMTFAPWVLVTVFNQKVQVMAILLFVGGVIGIWFKPALGHWIDTIGEKKIIVAEGVFLVLVCFGYGFSKDLFSETLALYVTFACFIADQLLMSVGMARATYLRKIGENQAEVTSTLTMGTTLDHIFSISIALIGGIIWNSVGYKYIFLLGCVIAAMSAVSGLFIRLPEK